MSMPDVFVDEETQAAKARSEAQMEAVKPGSSSLPVQMDYFAFEETHIVTLPDGVSWIEHQTLNEGQRRKYLNQVNKEVALKRLTGDAVMKLQSGDDKHTLLVSAISGWNLMRNGKPIPFSKGSGGATLEMFLEKAPPKIIDLIEKDVRKHNTWLMVDLSVEDLQKQIDELEEMKQAKIRDDAGKDS